MIYTWGGCRWLSCSVRRVVLMCHVCICICVHMYMYIYIYILCLCVLVCLFDCCFVCLFDMFDLLFDSLFYWGACKILGSFRMGSLLCCLVLL